MTQTHDISLTAAGFAFRVRAYPAAEPNGALLVWLHGGAFMFGTLEMPEADQVGQRLSDRGITVVSVDYTLAPLDAVDAFGPPPEDMDVSPEQMRAEVEAAGPRARFPVPSLQIVAAFDWAVENAVSYGADPGRVSLGGASAGANLSAGAAMRLRDRARRDLGAPSPRVLALVYPSLHDGILEPNAETAEILRAVPADRLFTPEIRAAINRNYLPDPDDPEPRTPFPAATTWRGCRPRSS
jgi:acetyl esterase